MPQRWTPRWPAHDRPPPRVPRYRGSGSSWPASSTVTTTPSSRSTTSTAYGSEAWRTALPVTSSLVEQSRRPGRCCRTPRPCSWSVTTSRRALRVTSLVVAGSSRRQHFRSLCRPLCIAYAQAGLHPDIGPDIDGCTRASRPRSPVPGSWGAHAQVCQETRWRFLASGQESDHALQRPHWSSSMKPSSGPSTTPCSLITCRPSSAGSDPWPEWRPLAEDETAEMRHERERPLDAFRRSTAVELLFGPKSAPTRRTGHSVHSGVTEGGRGVWRWVPPGTAAPCPQTPPRSSAAGPSAVASINDELLGDAGDATRWRSGLPRHAHGFNRRFRTSHDHPQSHAALAPCRRTEHGAALLARRRSAMPAKRP